MADLTNPNEYDDESFTRYSLELDAALGGLWGAGASATDIEQEIGNALENATGSPVSVALV